jgi:hypothetical protein
LSWKGGPASLGLKARRLQLGKHSPQTSMRTRFLEGRFQRLAPGPGHQGGESYPEAGIFLFPPKPAIREGHESEGKMVSKNRGQTPGLPEFAGNRYFGSRFKHDG